MFLGIGAPGSTPANPNCPTISGIPELLQGLNEDQLMLGKVAPFWIPDSDAANCMICDSKFTVVRRRHHCRACGQVLCSLCCTDKFHLAHMKGKEGRVCKPCKGILERLVKAEESQLEFAGGAERPAGVAQVENNSSRPNPANPMEYCSTIPPMQQVSSEVAGAGSASPPSVMVPVGVLKRPDTSNSGEAAKPSGDPKSVSDHYENFVYDRHFLQHDSKIPTIFKG
jgi:MAD (mothers against decapentaplegic) interacting protein